MGLFFTEADYIVDEDVSSGLLTVCVELSGRFRAPPVRTEVWLNISTTSDTAIGKTQNVGGIVPLSTYDREV